MDVFLVDYPKPWLLFWIAVLVAHGYMDFSFYRKWSGWARGIKQSLPAGNSRWRAFLLWGAEVLLQRQLFGLSPFRWLAHILIFWGFVGLALLSLCTFILKPAEYLGIGGIWTHFFLRGEGYPLVKIWGDACGLALLLGLVLAGIRRFVIRPPQQSNNQMDFFLLLLLFWLTLSGFVLEGLRLSLVPYETARYSFIGQYFVFPGNYTVEQLGPWLTAVWIAHAFSVVGFLVYLPHSKMMHSILAPLVIALNALEEQKREDIYWPDIKKYRATKSPGD